MVKILAAGDLHGDSSLAKKLAEKAKKEEVDVIILNGDLVEEENPEGIVGHFANLGKKVILLHGNHETKATADFLAQFYGATNLHGYSIMQEDIGIFGCGGANVGLDQLSEKEIFETLKKNFEKVKNAKTRIMVTHVHPAGTKIARFSSFLPPSQGVRKAIDVLKPDIVVCGHVHEAEGIEEKIGSTKVINVGKSGAILEF